GKRAARPRVVRGLAAVVDCLGQLPTVPLPRRRAIAPRGVHPHREPSPAGSSPADDRATEHDLHARSSAPAICLRKTPGTEASAGPPGRRPLLARPARRERLVCRLPNARRLRDACLGSLSRYSAEDALSMPRPSHALPAWPKVLSHLGASFLVSGVRLRRH